MLPSGPDRSSAGSRRLGIRAGSQRSWRGILRFRIWREQAPLADSLGDLSLAVGLDDLGESLNEHDLDLRCGDPSDRISLVEYLASTCQFLS